MFHVSLLVPAAAGLYLYLLLVSSVYIASALSMSAIINPPTPVTWSNRLGRTLTPVATGVWAAERPFTWNTIDVGGRSVICRAGDGTLLVHSPVGWNEELGRCLEALGGGVGHVVSPNYEHLKYAAQWAEVYPDAKMWACPGLRERLPDIEWAGELGVDPNPMEFEDAVEYVHFDCEINPFTGRPFFNEVAFFHTKSKTLFMADIFWNYPKGPLPNYCGREGTGMLHECPKMPADYTGDTLPAIEVPLGTKLWKAGMDKVYLPFYKNFMVGREGERRERYERAVAQVLEWEPEVIAPCHGDVIRGKDLCREVLREHFF